MLQSELRNALNTGEIQRLPLLKSQLVTLHLDFCRALRGRELTLEEVANLTAHYTHTVERDFQGGSSARKSVCWVCLSGVSSGDNLRCSDCGWLVCVCGACQCPDYWNGVRKHDQECQEQTVRLGQEAYRELLSERVNRMARYAAGIRQSRL